MASHLSDILNITREQHVLQRNIFKLVFLVLQSWPADNTMLYRLNKYIYTTTLYVIMV